MVEVRIVNKDQQTLQIRELFLEHLHWANWKVTKEFGIDLDATAMQEKDMRDLNKFMPPQGLLLLAYSDDALAGIAFLKLLGLEIGETKRMYVRPQNRRQGVVSGLLNKLLAEAAKIGYERILLDSAIYG